MRTSSCNLTQYNLLTALLILADSRNDHGGSKSRGEDISLHVFEERNVRLIGNELYGC